MELKDLYSLVVVEDPRHVRDWYVRHLGFTVAFEADWFVYLVSGGTGRRFGIAFMREGLDQQLPQFRQRFAGDSLILSVEVEDARMALDSVRATGLEPAVELRDEPWGQRHFLLRDPAGVWVDIIQPIEPDPAFFGAEVAAQLQEAVEDSHG
ncbi:Glyoxalase/Bleomycin resistance protein/Dioxygenase superfamily protein [Amycolatopsis marina]|uniref:Glyoxalase/Bleomycin resistance protein/Dioxygenase superfamily protein n=1 Tax=Amycolatopsis marina TaxID=490629 RepID=A0A1I1BPI1_9PSEU|nr:VOC family protein [Amycolatopsis marina]SFB50253.1 Glyoxalase/Bleomycin resistance protein/Dioxygenase superfamily protein [Amycolatopsis marina]